MLNVSFQSKFKKDIKLLMKRRMDLAKLELIVEELRNDKPLAPKYKNHKLQGNYLGCWECHIEPDWLLIYEKTKTEIILVRTGTHSDLF